MSVSVAPLPFQQRAVGFSPPTQTSMISPKGLDCETKGSRVVRKLSHLLSRTKTASSITGLDTSQASGGSFQSIHTPQMLWPETPTPTDSMHPDFHLYSGSRIRGSAGFAPPASIPELDALSSDSVESFQAAPSTVAAPLPATQMVWVPMSIMQVPAASTALPQPSTAVCSSVQGNVESMPPVLLGRSGCPSVGSALHGTGKCQPCAWFWKAGRGCQAGANCDHCHLCQEGELKARKKAKVAAMRMGLL